MIALSTVAQFKPETLYKKIDLILKTIKEGTLITEVWGIQTLVNLSLCNTEYKGKLLPVLIDYLETCRPIDFAKRIETILPVIKSPEENEIVDNIITIKTPELSPAQHKKLKSVLKKNGK